MMGQSKVAVFRVIIRIRVEYEQYFTYGRADRKVNDGITFEQSHFSKIHESKTLAIRTRAVRTLNRQIDSHTDKQTTVTLLRMRRGLINTIFNMACAYYSTVT